MGEENLANFLVRLSIDEALLAEYAAAKTDPEKKVILKREGLSEAAVDAVLGDDDVAIRKIASINQNNFEAINQNNQNNG